jgi:hypothetical protein
VTVATTQDVNYSSGAGGSSTCTRGTLPDNAWAPGVYAVTITPLTPGFEGTTFQMTVR